MGVEEAMRICRMGDQWRISVKRQQETCRPKAICWRTHAHAHTHRVFKALSASTMVKKAIYEVLIHNGKKHKSRCYMMKPSNT